MKITYECPSCRRVRWGEDNWIMFICYCCQEEMLKRGMENGELKAN